MRKKNRNIIIAALFALALVGVFLAFFIKADVAAKPAQATDETAAPAENGTYLHITYNGKDYTYNSRIVTVLYAGVDSDAALTTYNRYSIAPRADTIELVVFDDYHKTISILALSRDTITSVARYTMNGNYRDNYETHLGFAYTYGDGGKVSCENLMESVRALIGDVPVQEYVITNNASIGTFNDMAGGITVTVPNDDLAEKCGLHKGDVVTLDAEMADTFARWRDTTISFTNNGRMERQKEFSSQFFKAFISMMENDTEGTWKQIESISDVYQTSITKSQYLDFVERCKTETFSADSYYIPVGENEYDEANDVDLFYVDEDDLTEIIVKLFYLEDE